MGMFKDLHKSSNKPSLNNLFDLDGFVEPEKTTQTLSSTTEPSLDDEEEGENNDEDRENQQESKRDEVNDTSQDVIVNETDEPVDEDDNIIKVNEKRTEDDNVMKVDATNAENYESKNINIHTSVSNDNSAPILLESENVTNKTESKIEAACRKEMGESIHANIIASWKHATSEYIRNHGVAKLSALAKASELMKAGDITKCNPALYSKLESIIENAETWASSRRHVSKLIHEANKKIKKMKLLEEQLDVLQGTLEKESKLIINAETHEKRTASICEPLIADALRIVIKSLSKSPINSK